MTSGQSEKTSMLSYFEEHYRHLTYVNEHHLVSVAAKWLAETLGRPEEYSNMPAVKFVLPQGIGDSMWALLKIRSISASRKIAILLSGDPRKEVDKRAVPFLKRFSFVNSVEVIDIPILHDRDHPTDNRGRYNYLSDGQLGEHYYLVPNRTLEAGRRIETWLPEHPVDWEVMDEFDWTGTDRGWSLGQELAPFVAFYLGPEQGHTNEGHNYGWLWEPKHWIELAAAFIERGFRIVVVGAPYDRSFWEHYVREGVEQAGQSWVDLIGTMEIGETLALLRRARCLVSYQCGLAIVAHYLGRNVVSWWRPDGLSGHPTRQVSFDNAMKDSFIRPGWEDRWMGLLYKQETPTQIIEEIDRRGWFKE